MTNVHELAALGREMGLLGDELKKFVKEQQTLEELTDKQNVVLKTEKELRKKRKGKIERRTD